MTEEEKKIFKIGMVVFLALVALIHLGAWVWLCKGTRRSSLEVSKDDLSGEFRPIGLCTWFRAGSLLYRATELAGCCCCIRLRLV